MYVWCLEGILAGRTRDREDEEGWEHKEELRDRQLSRTVPEMSIVEGKQAEMEFIRRMTGGVGWMIGFVSIDRFSASIMSRLFRRSAVDSSCTCRVRCVESSRTRLAQSRTDPEFDPSKSIARIF